MGPHWPDAPDLSTGIWAKASVAGRKPNGRGFGRSALASGMALTALLLSPVRAGAPRYAETGRKAKKSGRPVLVDFSRLRAERNGHYLGLGGAWPGWGRNRADRFRGCSKKPRKQTFHRCEAQSLHLTHLLRCRRSPLLPGLMPIPDCRGHSRDYVRLDRDLPTFARPDLEGRRLPSISVRRAGLHAGGAGAAVPAAPSMGAPVHWAWEVPVLRVAPSGAAQTTLSALSRFRRAAFRDLSPHPHEVWNMAVHAGTLHMHEVGVVFEGALRQPWTPTRDRAPAIIHTQCDRRHLKPGLATPRTGSRWHLAPPEPPGQ